MEQTAKRLGTRVWQALFCALPAALTVLPAYAAAGRRLKPIWLPPFSLWAWAAAAVIGILAAVVLAVIVITFIKNPASPG